MLVNTKKVTETQDTSNQKWAPFQRDKVAGGEGVMETKIIGTISPGADKIASENILLGETVNARNTFFQRHCSTIPQNKKITIVCVIIFIALMILGILIDVIENPKKYSGTTEGNKTKELGGIFSDYSGTVEGNTAKVKVIAQYTVSITANRVAEVVYDVAESRKEVSKIIVSVYMSKEGLIDKYGNPLGRGELRMGDILISDVDEVRKYVRSSTYVYKNMADFEFRISRMQHAYLLK